MNTRTALGVAGVVAVAVVVGVVAGLTLGGGPVGDTDAETPTVTSTPTSRPTGTPVLATVSSTTTPTPTGTPEPSVSPSAVEYHVYQRVNYLRTTRGYDRLELNGSLREVARYHSGGMAAGGYVGHRGPRGETLGNRLARFGVDCESSAETVGRATFGTPIQADDGATVTYDTAEAVAKAIVARWMDDANSRSEILRIEWTDVAVGVHTVDAEDGTVVYATQNLCEMASE